ncbi:MAG: sigma-70 family RNA polymerase sigma factor [Alphaproteobacteria bacterium]|nr:sigma-70 family RNA polymerase sigma factor [Alphaproteobacteria bacterium]
MQAESVSEEDISALLAAVRDNGNIDAFETVFRHFAPRIRAYMLRLVKDARLAEELVQETMMTVWRKAALFDPAKGNAGTWVFTIARNLRIDSYRRAKRPDFDPDDPAFIPDPEPGADAALQARQAEARLHAAMKTLPPEQNELLHMAFFEELSHSTIAARLGLPLGTVKSRIRLAFAKLRAALEEHPQ